MQDQHEIVLYPGSSIAIRFPGQRKIGAGSYRNEDGGRVWGGSWAYMAWDCGRCGYNDYLA